MQPPKAGSRKSSWGGTVGFCSATTFDSQQAQRAASPGAECDVAWQFVSEAIARAWQQVRLAKGFTFSGDVSASLQQLRGDTTGAASASAAATGNAQHQCVGSKSIPNTTGVVMDRMVGKSRLR